MKLKAIALSLALASSPIQAEDTELIVFGDSLSSSFGRWPSILAKLEVPELYIKNFAQGGLSLIYGSGKPRFTVPEWLVCFKEGNGIVAKTRIVYWLGSNDTIHLTPAQQYREQLNLVIKEFKKRKCEVTYVLPIEGNPAWSFYKKYQARREITIRLYERHGIEAIDVPVNWNWTTDGVHPNGFQSFVWAIHFANKLGL